MLLSVQQAARRLGVSPVTVRRWTGTGFLPCTRTAGGHRRIDEHDLDDLAGTLGDRTRVAAQLAREREVEVLTDTAIALAGRLDLGELLHEIAMRMTSLLDCQFCAISDYDADAGEVVTLAEYDHAGHRLADESPYKLHDFPLTRRVLADQVTMVVNVDDPEADAAEVAELRREGDRSLLMVPLVVRGDTIGLLEVVDQRRSRQYSRQELRLAGAVAGQAAVAITNARLFAERRRSRDDITALRRALAALTRRVPEGVADAGVAEALGAVATAVCDAFEAVSCVVGAGGVTAGASGAAILAAGDPADAPAIGAAASLMVADDPSGRTDLRIAVTLREPPGEGQSELLDFMAALAANAVRDPDGLRAPDGARASGPSP